jgi:hypothetical protein
MAMQRGPDPEQTSRMAVHLVQSLVTLFDRINVESTYCAMVYSTVTTHHSPSFPSTQLSFLQAWNMAYRLLLAFSNLKSCTAATCYEGQGKAPNIQLAWDLRQQICGSENACSKSDAARGNNHYCTLYRFFNRGVSFIQFERNDPSGYYKNWYAS